MRGGRFFYPREEDGTKEEGKHYKKGPSEKEFSSI